MNILRRYIQGLFPICQGERRRDQIHFILDGILINAATMLTTGMFLSGYFIYLGASDFLIGILNNAGAWALILSLFSFIIYERMESRKRLLISLNIISRMLLCSIVYLPIFLPSHQVVIKIASVMVILGNLLWGIYSTGIIVWMINLLPHNRRNNYIYVRMFYLRISFTLTTIIAGRLLDIFNKSYMGFVVIYSISLLISLVDAYILSKTYEPPNKIAKKKRVDAKRFTEPVRGKEFGIYLIFVFFFYLSTTLSSSFTSLYQIKYLGLDYSFISIINVLSYLMMIGCTRFWGRMEEKLGIGLMLGITGLFIMLEFFVYSFINKETVRLLYLASILAGIGNSGFNVGIATHRYNLTPDENKTIYEGWFGAIYGISTMIGPIIGNYMKTNIFTMEFQSLYRTTAIMGATVLIIAFFRPSDIRKYISNL